jgi:hypothetical protein
LATETVAGEILSGFDSRSKKILKLEDIEVSNKYIFLNNTLSNIGGAQLYIKNKLKYLKCKSWDVYIFQSRNSGEILIDELKKEPHYVFEHLKYPPNHFTKHTRNKVIVEIISQINIDENGIAVIESHNLSTAQWGELLAKELRCKNFIYLLGEGFNNTNKQLLDFFVFKHQRRELAGTSKESLGLLFSDYYKLLDNEEYFLKAVSAEEIVQDISVPIIESIERADINICCISRLEKPFVKTMINEIIVFANKHKNLMIQLVLIGDSPKYKDIDFIINKTKQQKNIKTVLTGRLYPIPKNLFSKIDLFIGVAGSIRVSAIRGKLSLAINVDTHKPIGLMGVDTNNGRYGKSDKYDNISEAIESILIEQRLQENIDLLSIKIDKLNYNDEFNEHMKFLDNSINTRIYNTKDILKQKYTIRCVLKKILIIFLGINRFERLIKYLRK